MAEDQLHEHLSRISTMWTALHEAHHGSSGTAASARDKLMRRYLGAVYRYLYAVVRNPHVADELTQDFAVFFLRGKFKGAHPEKGKFRYYIKTVLFNLIRDYKNDQKRQKSKQVSDLLEPLQNPETPEFEQQFLAGWRDELLAKTWEALEVYQAESGRLFHTVLDFRTKFPDSSSAQTAEALSEQLGKPYTAANVRQITHRAREKFGDLLVEEVSRSLENTDSETIAQELIDLGLLSHCEDALQRWTDCHGGA